MVNQKKTKSVKKVAKKTSKLTKRQRVKREQNIKLILEPKKKIVNLKRTRGKTDQRKINLTLRRLEWAQLRARGWTFEEIGNKYGCTGANIVAGVNKFLAEIKEESQDELRRNIIFRYNDVLKRAYVFLESPKASVAHRGGEMILRVNDSLRKMFGLDVPASVNINPDITTPINVVFRSVRKDEIDSTEEKK